MAIHDRFSGIRERRQDHRQGQPRERPAQDPRIGLPPAPPGLGRARKQIPARRITIIAAVGILAPIVLPAGR